MTKGGGHGLETQVTATSPGKTRPSKSPTPGGQSTQQRDAASHLEYGYTSPCRGAKPGQDGADVLCSGAFSACDGITPPTSLTVVWRRQVDAGGNPAPGQGWSRVGEYCVPPNLPGAPPPHQSHVGKYGVHAQVQVPLASHSRRLVGQMGNRPDQPRTKFDCFRTRNQTATPEDQQASPST